MVKSPNKVQARQVRHIQDIPVDETPNLRERRYSFCFDRERREQKQRRGRGRNKNNDSATLINPPISQYLAWPGRGDKLTADRDPTMPPKQGIYFKKRSLQALETAQAGQGSSSDSVDDSSADQASDASLQFSKRQVSAPPAVAAPAPAPQYANRWRKLTSASSSFLQPASDQVAQNTMSQFGGVCIEWNASKKVHDMKDKNLVPDNSPPCESAPDSEPRDTTASVPNANVTENYGVQDKCSHDSRNDVHLPLGASLSSTAVLLSSSNSEQVYVLRHDKNQEQATDSNSASGRLLLLPAAFSSPAPYASVVRNSQLMRIGALYDADPTPRSQRGKQNYKKNKKQRGKQSTKQQLAPRSKARRTSADDPNTPRPAHDLFVEEEEALMEPSQSLNANADSSVAETDRGECETALATDADHGAENQHGGTNAEVDTALSLLQLSALGHKTFAGHMSIDEWPLSFSRSRSFGSLHSLDSQPPSPFEPGASNTASSTQWTVESIAEEICADTDRIINDRSVSSPASSPEPEPRTPVGAIFSGSNDKETWYAITDYDIDAAGDTMMDPGLMDVIVAKDADPAADDEQSLAPQQGVKRKRKESSFSDSDSTSWDRDKRTRAARECLNKAIGLLKSIAGESYRATIEALEREYDALYNA
ncbi:hypothetical protein A1Q1_02148 [Trichosporon asahii var. asahii CBS 2479]|uniref:Uncharacterized protein n=1 Tax=Trichosporon asahii var. asahii (strain ATCC 90039 / CBS 2479 / JCM 2466 / KCTC 7840 / NBRC 103889/ NCYC 2677 / UAMH 7654) TaxID=1186058 RepID=J5QS28_TRIAS|nr:hypothetical protein A1Q1_02148 [Trichosporon asahii var. asahii CBS 2479]EJT48813.1 hypothetical protein A1Q1_02148 [Trichosporon asahii var. asahii CBS 2479]